MTLRLLGATSALCLLMSASAFAADVDQPGHQSPAPGTSNETMSAVKDITAGAIGQVAAHMISDTRGFVNAAATSDMYEVEAGKIAESRGQAKAVRDLAAKMVKAHTQSTDKLKGVLADNAIAVTLPAHVDDRRQGMLDDLRGAKDEDFDHRYLAQQEAAHKEAQILLKGYADTGDNAALKTFAAEIRPIVNDHLAMIQALEANRAMAVNSR